MDGVSGRVVTLAIGVALLAGCTTGPNEDGWWDEGVHAVDGYWVTEERHCSQDDAECAVALYVALRALSAIQPEAVVSGAWMASYPNRRGDSANEITHTFGGLVQPWAIILDLEGGTRRLINLSCGAFDAGGAFECRPETFDIWRVGNRETPPP